FGLVAAERGLSALLAAAASLRPLGTLFLNLLSLVVIPLVVTALFAGVAGLGSMRHVGRLGIRTLGFFWATTLAAIVIGFVVAAQKNPKDRKSTRLNSSHVAISYAVFCLKKKISEYWTSG